MNWKRTVLAFLVLVWFTACKQDEPTKPPVLVVDPGRIPASISYEYIRDSIRAMEIIPLHIITSITTYDGSNQSTHPDAGILLTSWSGWEDLLVLTPYPNSNPIYENASLKVSHDLNLWSTPSWIKAPLVTSSGTDYNSDPELVSDGESGRCLGVLNREVKEHRDWIQILVTCSQGQSWTEPIVILSMPNYQAISPTIAVGPDVIRRLYYVDAGADGCNATSTRVWMREATKPNQPLDSPDFKPPVLVDMNQANENIWHLKTGFIGAKSYYMALYPAYSKIGYKYCVMDDLFAALSRDGLHWTTFNVPLLDRSDERFDLQSWYRATFIYNPVVDGFDMIVAGYKNDGTWALYGATFSWRVFEFLAHSNSIVRPDVPMPIAAENRRSLFLAGNFP